MAKPTAAWDARWGKGFLTPDQFVELVYRTIGRELNQVCLRLLSRERMDYFPSPAKAR